MNFAEAIQSDRLPPVDIALDDVARKLDVSPDELRSKSKKNYTVVCARHAAAWLLRERGYSYSEIGRAMRRNHATIMYSVEKVSVEMAVKPHLRKVLERLKGAA